LRIAERWLRRAIAGGSTSVEWDTERIRLFLLAHVESFEELELLLVLASSPDRNETAQAAAARTGVSVADARQALEHLATHGFLVVDAQATGPSFRYRPADIEIREGVNALLRAHAQSRTMLGRLMSTNAVERMRRWNAKAFADAFVIGRKKDDG
jgi:predicted ArsR family transcriptional regulator